MKIIEQIKASVKPWRKTIAFAVGKHFDVIEPAIEKIVEEGLARVIIIANHDVCTRIQHRDVKKINISNDFRTRAMAASIEDLRVFPDWNYNKILERMEFDGLMYGATLLRDGLVDALIVDSCYSEKDIFDTALPIVGYKSNVNTISTSHLVCTPRTEFGENGLLLFGDCHLVERPTSEQLADIAVSTTEKAQLLMGQHASKTSLLCFSSKGSASHPLVDVVASAYEILTKRKVNFTVDGELQLDASIVPSVGKSKAPQSPVAGHANVLIFPDLNAANIGYNLVSAFGDIESIGPMWQGFSKPVQILPVDFTTEDVMNLSLIAVLSSTI